MSSEQTDEGLKQKVRDLLKSKGWLESVAGKDYEPAVEKVARLYANLRKPIGIDHPRYKGLLVSGETGCGKTTLVEAIGCYEERINCDIIEEVAYLDYEKYPEYVRELMSKSVFIDDLGADRIRNNYGEHVDIIGDFICRYHRYGKKWIMATTNLHGKAIIEQKGRRVFSRFADLFYPLKMVGEDKRMFEI